MRRAASLSRLTTLSRALHSTPQSHYIFSSTSGIQHATALRGLSTNISGVDNHTMPGLVFSRSQTFHSQARSNTPSEYVEDSEPEREERRLRAKARRKVMARSKALPQSVPDVIEVSDSDHTALSLSKQVTTSNNDVPAVIIDLCDNSGSDSDHIRDTSPRENSTLTVDSTIDSSVDETADESFPSVGRLLGVQPTARHAQPSGGSPTSRSPERSKPASSPVNAAPVSPLRDTQESDEEAGNRLGLSRFAYTPSVSSRRTASKTPSEHDSQILAIKAGPSKPKRGPKPPDYAFATYFAEAELAQVRKCVSCDTAWTVRKSVANKLKHIQTCARKKKLSDDTIRALLRDELRKLPPIASTSKSGQPESTPAVQETLLEEALKDTHKKKAGRRPQVLQTVRSVSETRDTILDRARLLLQDTQNTAHNNVASSSRPSVLQDIQMPPPTQAFGKSSVAVRRGSYVAPPAETTHTFQQSRLGTARVGVVRIGAEIAAHSDVSPLTQAFSTSALGAAVDAGHSTADELPPATQVFAPSKLSGATRRVVTQNDDLISIHDTSEDDNGRSSPARPISILSSPSSSVKRPRSSRSPKSPAVAAQSGAPSGRSPSPLRIARSPSPGGDEVALCDVRNLDEPALDYVGQDINYTNIDDWNSNDAYLHYDPEDDAPVAGPSELPAAHAQSRSPKRLAAILEDAPQPGPSEPNGGNAQSSEPPKKRTRRKKAAPATESDAEAGVGVGKNISQEDLNAKMKTAILADETLHLRVLRYEPIHFDVFMKLATDLGFSEKRTGLKVKVKAFLDQQAIHFHDVDPSKTGTRRRHR